jgi:hypothetical protein
MLELYTELLSIENHVKQQNFQRQVKVTKSMKEMVFRDLQGSS